MSVIAFFLFSKIRGFNNNLSYDCRLIVGNSTRELTYSRISPILSPRRGEELKSIDSEVSDENSTGANSKKMNEISPRIMYRA